MSGTRSVGHPHPGSTASIIALSVAGLAAGCDIIAGLNDIEARPHGATPPATSGGGESVASGAAMGGGGSASTASSMGGGGGAAECSKPEDCKPQPVTKCLLATCEMSKCGTKPAMANTTCSDNGGTICDGAGSCVSPACINGKKDNKETDIDCGGADCKKCGNNLGCNKGADCTSGYCDTSKPKGGAMGTCSPCTMDSQCGTQYCSAAKTCVDKLDQGKPCNKAAMCKNDLCVDDFCCDTACTEPCKWCGKSGSEGKCSVVLKGPYKELCGGYMCDGTSGACPSSCAMHDDCLVSHYCKQPACVEKLALGKNCTTKEECKIPYCTNGRCCITQMCTSPQTCNNDQGICKDP